MEKVYSLGLAETYTKETIMRMKGMGMVRCCGQMEACTRANGAVGSNMESEG